MSDRTESLLSELVELQRRAVTNQERALAVQDQSIALQTEGIVRYRRAMRVIFSLIGVVMVLIVGTLLAQFLVNGTG